MLSNIVPGETAEETSSIMNPNGHATQDNLTSSLLKQLVLQTQYHVYADTALDSALIKPAVIISVVFP
jgi:hypothetical protein